MDSNNSEEGGNKNLALSLGFSFVLLLALVIISYFSYKCTRSWSSPPHLSATNTSSHSVVSGVGTGARGLVEADLVNYPKFTFSQAKNVKVGDIDVSMVSANSGSSICLADYKDCDTLRLLPECGHYFHLRCVDPWLKLHPTCPLCRSSPVPILLASLSVDHPH